MLASNASCSGCAPAERTRLCGSRKISFVLYSWSGFELFLVTRANFCAAAVPAPSPSHPAFFHEIEPLSICRPCPCLERRIFACRHRDPQRWQKAGGQHSFRDTDLHPDEVPSDPEDLGREGHPAQRDRRRWHHQAKAGRSGAPGTEESRSHTRLAVC